MKFIDILKLSLNSLTHRKLRSWLTVLGIVIGVTAVVALVSLGESAQASITSQLGGLGANTITISQGRIRAFGGGTFGEREQGAQTDKNLTESDLRIIKSASGVEYANGIVSGNAKVSFLGQTVSSSITGVDTSAWKFMETTALASGRYLSQGDAYVAVIGDRIANQVFKQAITLNRQITIGGQNFAVVGILKAAGSFGQEDSSVYISKDVARNILDDVTTNQLSSIKVQVSDTSSVDTVVAEIEKKLLVAHHVTEQNKDFTVTSAQSIQERVSSITGTMTLLLGAIAGIALLVSAIGIANTMFMSVMERTRLIGVLKALGTTNAEIMKLFLMESAIMGFVGGVLGVVAGLLLSDFIVGSGLNIVGMGSRTSDSMTPVVNPQLILFVICFSVVIGVISGLLPARRAAGLQPVDALGYE